MDSYIFKSESSLDKLKLTVISGEGNTIWEMDYPSYVENVLSGEMIEDPTVIELGIMKSPTDITGLQVYLRKQGIIPADRFLVSERIHDRSEALRRAEQLLVEKKKLFPPMYREYIPGQTKELVKMIADQVQSPKLDWMETHPIDIMKVSVGEEIVKLSMEAFPAEDNFKKGGTIDTDTPILPEIVADGVAHEMIFENKDLSSLDINQKSELYPRLVNHLVEKANDLYVKNDHFKSRILGKGNKGRDALYMFMRHWSEAWIKKGSRKMEKGGEVELTGASKYVVDYFKKEKVARQQIRKSNPKYQEQIDGLKQAIDQGYVWIDEDRKDPDIVYIRPGAKLRDQYFSDGGETSGSIELAPEIIGRPMEDISLIVSTGHSTFIFYKGVIKKFYKGKDAKGMLVDQITDFRYEPQLSKMYEKTGGYYIMRAVFRKPIIEGWNDKDDSVSINQIGRAMLKDWQELSGDHPKHITLGNYAMGGVPGMVITKYPMDGVTEKNLIEVTGYKKGGMAHPWMGQYSSIKEKYPDSIVLFGIGDYHMAFGDQAKIVSEIIGTPLQASSNKPPFDKMTEFDSLQAIDIVSKISRAGHKVAVVDQLQDPKLIKGKVKRGVTGFSEADNNNKVSDPDSLIVKFSEKYGVDPFALYNKAMAVEGKNISLRQRILQAADTLNISGINISGEELILAMMEGDIKNIRINKSDKIRLWDIDEQTVVVIKPIETSLPKPTEPLEAFKTVVSTDDLRPAMTGVYYDEKRQQMVGTDAHILGIFPAKITGESRIVDIKTGKPVFEKGENYHKYPDYSVVLPEGNIYKFKNIPVQKLYDQFSGIVRANSFVEEGELGITCFLHNPFGTCYFHPDRVMDSLKFLIRLGAKNVDFEFNPLASKTGDLEKGFYIRNSENSKNFCLVMPIYRGSKILCEVELGEPEVRELTQKEYDELANKLVSHFHRQGLADELKKKKPDQWAIDWHTEEIKKGEAEAQEIVKKLKMSFRAVLGTPESQPEPEKPTEPKEQKRPERSIAADKKRKALKPGRRVSAAGKVYYESRPDHSDKDRRIKL